MQCRAIQPRDLLTGVIYERDTEDSAFVYILLHGRRIVGGDDNQIRVFWKQVFQGELFCVGHRAGVERRDLVVGKIGIDEKRRRENLINLPNSRGVHTCCFQPCAVVAEVLTDRSHQFGARMLPEQGEVVGDVGRHAAPVFGHIVHKKAQADMIQFVGDEVFGELAGEAHQIVVGN